MFDVSVIIVSWNTCQLLERCLTSLTRELTSGDAVSGLEIFVVDNASIDGSQDMVAERFSDVQLIRNSGNVGFAAANNQAAAISNGRYLLLLNSDTEMRSGALRALAEALDSEPTTGIVGARLLESGGDLQLSCSRSPSPWRELVHLMHLDGVLPGLYYPCHRWPLDRRHEVDTVMGAAMMIRREAWEAVGGLNEGYFMYAEEVELCEHVRSAGWNVVWEPRAVVLHHGGASSRQVSEDMFHALYSSKLRFFARNRSVRSRRAFKCVLVACAVPRIAVGWLCRVLPGPWGRGLERLGRRYAKLLKTLFE